MAASAPSTRTAVCCASAGLPYPALAMIPVRAIVMSLMYPSPTNQYRAVVPRRGGRRAESAQAGLDRAQVADRPAVAAPELRRVGADPRRAVGRRRVAAEELRHRVRVVALLGLEQVEEGRHRHRVVAGAGHDLGPHEVRFVFGVAAELHECGVHAEGPDDLLGKPQAAIASGEELAEQ